MVGGMPSQRGRRHQVAEVGAGGGEVRCCFKAWDQPVGNRGERSRSPQDRAHGLSPGPPRSPAGPRPEGLEGPGVEKCAPLFTALSAGTDLALLYAGERGGVPEVPCAAVCELRFRD